MNLSEKILKLRTARGMSQGDLAEKLEVSRQSVSKWETGQSVPDVDKLVRLADLFGVTTDYLLRETERASGKEAEPAELSDGAGRRALRPVQAAGILLTCFGLLLTALAAWAAGRGEMGHLELVMILLLVLPGLVLSLAPKHNLLAGAWALWSGSAAVFLPARRTANLVWLKKFYNIFVLSKHGSVSVGLWPWQVKVIFAIHGAMLALLVYATWRTLRKPKQDG